MSTLGVTVGVVPLPAEVDGGPPPAVVDVGAGGSAVTARLNLPHPPNFLGPLAIGAFFGGSLGSAFSCMVEGTMLKDSYIH